MTSITYENRGKTVRINIPAKEFSKLIPDNANRAIVEDWIAIGRERENLREHFEECLSIQFTAQKYEIDGLREQIKELNATIERYGAFFAQVAHSVTIATTAASHFDLEMIHFDKESGKNLTHEREQTYNLALLKNGVFKQLIDIFVPEVGHSFKLMNFLHERKKKGS